MVERSHTAGGRPGPYDPALSGGDWFAPKSDATASEKAYMINLELPGVDPADIEIVAQDGALIIQGEKRSERKEEEPGTYFFSEREYGAFLRAFRLPPDANEDAITADFKNGILTVTIAKAVSQPEASRRIEIRTSG